MLNIVIREEALDNSSEWRIRSTTAHELLHLIQFINGIGIDQHGNNIKIERQATFLIFSRGFAYDFLKTFPADCSKEICDHQFKYAYFNCNKIFSGCCRNYTEENLELLAKKLEKLASEYGLKDNPDYNKIVYDCLIKEHD